METTKSGERQAETSSAKANARPIIDQKIGPDGHFAAPKSFTAQDEVQWAKVRQDAIRLRQYADKRCGFSNLYDPAGAYLCGGRNDGSSSACNKREGAECLIRIQPLSDPHFQSCMFWETVNAGDPEARYSDKSKKHMTDERIAFGATGNPLGFGCVRCDEGRHMLARPDSEGRQKWCRLIGMPVMDNACCADNEPLAGSPKKSPNDRGDRGGKGEGGAPNDKNDNGESRRSRMLDAVRGRRKGERVA
ncbi:MAG TPA: hypothetical protein VKZ53_18565 [Candidatus Angelobacter sp.]|nr:hypothetical protein [Candidatus Angelobacter sp.]